MLSMAVDHYNFTMLYPYMHWNIGQGNITLLKIREKHVVLL
jgi:hypothetical protein